MKIFIIILFLYYRQSGSTNTNCAHFDESLYQSVGSVVILTQNGTHFKEVFFLKNFGGSLSESKICKFECSLGNWSKPVCTNEKEFHIQRKQDGCQFKTLPRNMILTVDGATVVKKWRIRYHDGSTIMIRCLKQGVFKLLGSSALACVDHKWNGSLPVCINTNHFTGFSGDNAPPAISWNTPSGTAQLNDEGVLIVLPGTILHLDCLFPRIRGNPNWVWSSSHRKYPTGWSINTDDRNLHYRLSIYYANTLDSGLFTCETPQGYTNYIYISVKNIICQELNFDLGSGTITGTSLQLGAIRKLSCNTGYNIVGTPRLRCLTSGVWSAPTPTCKAIRCPKPTVMDRNANLVSLDVFFNGTASYKCPKNYEVEGSPTATCLLNSSWSSNPPRCVEIFCPKLPNPKHGEVKIIGYLAVGSAAMFSCSSGFINHGPMVLFCLNNGTWSKPTPRCRPACEHPGRPENGQLIPRRPKYEIGARALISCNTGYRPAGPDRLICMETRHWSSPLTPCVPSLAFRQIKNRL